MKTYKILDRETGLYAGVGGFFSKHGKAWGSASGFGGHLACLSKMYKGERYIVQEFELSPSRELTVDDYRKEVASRSHKKPRG